jgi:ubiquinone/menaquinone biosynthesis C-methylase UbiE
MARTTLTRPSGHDIPAPTSRSLRYARKNKWVHKVATWYAHWSSPEVTGPRDNVDLLHPGMERCHDIPGYYLANPVHGMKPESFGWMNPKIGKRYEEMCEDFTYAAHDNIAAWIFEHVVDARLPMPGRVLDLGAGTGPITRVWAEIFPDAEVIGVDISPSMLRWARKRADDLGLTNLRYYHMDISRLDAFESDSFDVVHDSHTFHEMPADYIALSLMEMVRVAKPGAMLAFFDWEIPVTEQDWRHRKIMRATNQEPFMLDYAVFNWPEVMRDMLGCDVVNTERRFRGWDRQSDAWKAFKGPDSNRLLAENRERIMDRARAAMEIAKAMAAEGRPTGPIWGAVTQAKGEGRPVAPPPLPGRPGS